MLNESEQDTLFKIIQDADSEQGSLTKLEELVQLLEAELLEEFEQGTVVKQNDDLVLTSPGVAFGLFSLIKNLNKILLMTRLREAGPTLV